jgi:predicted phage terminase large subunit-like protein
MTTNNHSPSGISEQQLLEHLLREDFRSFMERAFYELLPGTTFVPGWHIDYLCAELERCLKGQNRRLIINMPPRHMKSLLVSVGLVAFLLGQDPKKKIICVSYSKELAAFFSRHCRKLMQAEWYKSLFPQTRISESKNTELEFHTTAGGCRLSTSVEGTITGRGGDVIIIDDPMNASDVNSKVTRERINDWYESALYSRLDDKEKGVIILVMQRLHQDDMSGYLLHKNRKGWNHLVLPAISDSSETFTWAGGKHTCAVGEALWPERESLALLEDTKRAMGSLPFSAQYQQAPLPPQGTLMKRRYFHYYDSLPFKPKYDPAYADTPPGRVIQSWDTASKNGELNDYSVCTTFYKYYGKYYVVDVFRARLNFPELLEKVKNHANCYWTEQMLEVSHVIIEDMGTGTSLIQSFQRRSHGVSVIGFKPKRDKIMRFEGTLDDFKSGKLLFPRTASWLLELEAELLSFPNGRYDDQVDSISQFLEDQHIPKACQYPIKGLCY